jgi:hypothetical protein
MPRKLGALGVWLVAVAFIGGIGGAYIVPQLIYLHDLAAANRVTYGKIIETFPQLHSTCKYRYSVDGRFYEQSGRSCGDGQIGQLVTVYFSSTDPSKSLNQDPQAYFLNDLVPFVLALVLFPIFAAVAAYMRPDRLWGGWMQRINRNGKGSAPGN